MNYLDLPAFVSPESIHVVIESPRGSTVKLKYDRDMEGFALSRPLNDGVIYPYDWGFVPSTRGPDGDPIDAIVLWDRASFPGVVIECRLIGVLAVEQNSKQHPGERERNDRLMAIPLQAPRQDGWQSIDDLPRRIKDEVEMFFVASTALEKKNLKFLGWSGVKEAYDLVLHCARGRRPVRGRSPQSKKR